MKKRKNLAPAYYLPHDVVENILLRLSVESLVRFKSVCKSWKATIEDPRFARFHSNQLNLSNRPLCFYAEKLAGDGKYSLMKFKGQELYTETVVNYPYKFWRTMFLCCCEGIVVLKSIHHATEEYVLLNPFTREHLSFPCEYYSIFRDMDCPVGYGLCMDKYEDDYKLILILTDGKYMVYSIKNKIWTEKQSESISGLLAYSPGTYAKGLVYWTVRVSDFKEIIYYDPRDGLLKKLDRPEGLCPQDRRIDLTNLRGDLCLYTIFGSPIGIWLLKEDDKGGHKRWVRVYDYKIDDLVSLACRPLYLTGKDELVFDNDYGIFDGSGFAVYCLEKQKFGRATLIPVTSRMIMFRCSESLCFPTVSGRSQR